MSQIIQQYITYLENYHVLICRQCKFAISPPTITRHFRNKHKTIPLATRRAITEFALSIQLDEPDQIAYSDVEQSSIDDLELIKNGYQCQFNDCDECSKTEIMMMKHCRDDHNWIKSMGTVWSIRAVQTFFQRPYCRYDCVLSHADNN